MTRKDFELIARVLSKADSHLEQGQIEILASMFAGALCETNPNFNRERFILTATNTATYRAEFQAILAGVN